ncbi:hypothetical protein PMAYCL1PPCAC_24735 [Pristionchus mayeri]|uniref:Cysteine protease n=1 Tax=Pristionchus mayeri TaxID=1317129 RepID=A0AAN5I801_9BILA|nr:hypothetical protein PMAYCL1PPCAC_24735 [Pristionchus mayeri]
MIEMLTLETSFYELKDQFLSDAGSDVTLLGKTFECDGAENKSAAIKSYVTSRLWFTYRRYFPPIGGTGPSSDQGWGCMMRCAQMLMGEVLLRRHLGAHWEWRGKAEKPSGDYLRILKMFEDNKNALYSIHQIAQMSVSEGKQLAEWIGPNTAAQVLKKLSVFDAWSDVAVHVALDSLLVDDDVHQMATTPPDDDFIRIVTEDGKVDNTLSTLAAEERKESGAHWRPTLIIIPLRLGLTTTNPLYLKAIQAYFKLPQCVGILGGRPNHALYFVGIKDDKLIYLDPHYTQNTLRKSASCASFDKDSSMCNDDGFERATEAVEGTGEEESAWDEAGCDATFHCPTLLWMDYKDVDPSLALGFFCRNKEEYEDLARRLREGAMATEEKFPVFEHIDKRPPKLPKFKPYVGVKANLQMNEFLDMGEPNYEQDDAFEVLE